VSNATINYVENFQTTGVQATNDNTPLANYPSWTYRELTSSAGSEARVDTAPRISRIPSLRHARIVPEGRSVLFTQAHF
jgi:hypothetical protein